jgi:hypothetical protein
MPCVRFEPTIPVSERAKTVHTLDHSATVTSLPIESPPQYLEGVRSLTNLPPKTKVNTLPPLWGVPEFVSKSNLSCLGKRREVSLLFNTSRIQDIPCSNFELKKIYRFGVYGFFICCQIRRLEGCCTHREKEIITLDATPPFLPSRWSFQIDFEIL